MHTNGHIWIHTYKDKDIYIYGSNNFQSYRNLDSKNLRSVILSGFYQILNSENLSSGYICIHIYVIIKL
jgi:hypothetical protein